MKCTLVLTSVTYAIKAGRILSSHGIRSAPVKTPAVKNVRGCGYGIEVSSECDTAKGLLESSGIKVVGILASR